jgi:ATP-dependent DNA helicase RecQ
VKTALSVLRSYWGYEDFRFPQGEIVDSVLQKKDTLAILPTGAGKSICYQVPAMVMDGLCIVVTPLLSLMEDQISDLRDRGIKAVGISSQLPFKKADHLLNECVYGNIRFLFISPERIQSNLFLKRLESMRPVLFAIDEAHCIAQWGHDFRPAYLQIAKLREIHPNTPLLALTATATPEVREEIEESLLMRNAVVFKTSLERKNLGYAAIETADRAAKLKELLDKISGSSIIYANTRGKVKEIADWLNGQGIVADYFHAGRKYEEKEEAFQNWMQDKVRVMCATNAFGMGINKTNVRSVIHWNVPMSPEAYFQEAGRAGRDLKKSFAILLYHPSDEQEGDQKIEEHFPSREKVIAIYNALCDSIPLAIGNGAFESYPLDIASLLDRHSIEKITLDAVFKILETAGYVRMNEAYFETSRISMKLGHQDLIEFQRKNENHQLFIQTILRMYGGVQVGEVRVSEEQIAKQLRTTASQVIDRLKWLNQVGVLEYEMRKETPTFTLLTGRLHPASVIIDPSIYEDRKRAEVTRWKAIWRYIDNPDCRVQSMHQYFKESIPEPCGNCDRCLQKKRGQSSEKLEEKVLSVIQSQTLTIPELMQYFPKHQNELMELIRYFLDNKVIKMGGGDQIFYIKSE